MYPLPTVTVAWNDLNLCSWTMGTHMTQNKIPLIPFETRAVFRNNAGRSQAIAVRLSSASLGLSPLLSPFSSTSIISLPITALSSQPHTESCSPLTVTTLLLQSFSSNPSPPR